MRRASLSMPRCLNSCPRPYQRSGLRLACQTRPACATYHKLPRQGSRQKIYPEIQPSPDGWLRSTGEWKRATHGPACCPAAAAQGRAHQLRTKGGSRCHQQATEHTLAAFCFQTERLCASRCRLACITSSGKRPPSEALTKCHLQKLDHKTETSGFFSQAKGPVLLRRCKGNNLLFVALSCVFRPADRLCKSRGNSWAGHCRATLCPLRCVLG